MHKAIPTGIKLQNNDKRRKKFKAQRKKYGYDETELWNLDVSIAKFVLPRLKSFRETLTGHPGNLTLEQYEEILDKMIWSFTQIVKDVVLSQEQETKVEEGLNLFAKYYLTLWS